MNKQNKLTLVMCFWQYTGVLRPLIHWARVTRCLLVWLRYIAAKLTLVLGSARWAWRGRRRTRIGSRLRFRWVTLVVAHTGCWRGGRSPEKQKIKKHSKRTAIFYVSLSHIAWHTNGPGNSSASVLLLRQCTLMKYVIPFCHLFRTRKFSFRKNIMSFTVKNWTNICAKIVSAALT